MIQVKMPWFADLPDEVAHYIASLSEEEAMRFGVEAMVYFSSSLVTLPLDKERDPVDLYSQALIGYYKQIKRLPEPQLPKFGRQSSLGAPQQGGTAVRPFSVLRIKEMGR